MAIFTPGYPRKIIEKVSNRVFRLCGVDPLTRTTVKSRDDLKEIGTDHGGWVVPMSLLDANSICYCAGCGDNITFDLGLIDTFGCHVHGFDPTPQAIKHVYSMAGKNPRYHFYAEGLWEEEDTLKFFVPRYPVRISHSLVNLQKTEAYIQVKVKRLSTIMAALGHERLDLLKIDIEGAEYKVIESIIEDNIDIRVICLEYDEFFSPLDANYKKRIRTSVDSLQTIGYSLVCAQGNGNYTFVKK